MKKISGKIIANTVAELCINANVSLRSDVYQALKHAVKTETNRRAKHILGELLENADIARDEAQAICQDTGMPIVFVEIGSDVDISGVDWDLVVNQGIETGYRKGYFRNSIVLDPLDRTRGSCFSPAVIHFDFVKQKGLRLTILPKGFGCENKTQLKMFTPTTETGAVEDFIVSAVREAGPDACPPYVIGVGIGGTADTACLLAKKALLKDITHKTLHVTQYSAQKIRRMEQELLKRINKLKIGPMGLGGRTTVLGVNILTYPTHIAGLPVCVNVSCHALRSATKRL